jgi:glycosyltransferase involved in cell wall biosynthesis
MRGTKQRNFNALIHHGSPPNTLSDGQAKPSLPPAACDDDALHRQTARNHLSMRKQILFLSQCLPFPPHSGVTRRTYHVLQELQREFDVTLVAFSRRGHQPDAASLRRAAATLRRELSEVMAPVAISAERSFARKLGNHARSLLSRKPYIFYEYGDGRFGEELRLALRRASPELIHLDSMDLYRWLPSLPMVPTTCTHHSVESELLRLEADHASNPVVRGYIRHQADLVEKVERRVCPRLDLNVMTSEVDAVRLRALAPTARTTAIPNAVDVDFFRPGPPDEVVPGRASFLGPTYMYPNRDAVDFFLEEAWPVVRRDYPESTLHLIGKNSDDDRARFESRPGVTCNGHVPDIRPHLAQAAVSIVPIRVGGGTRLKILDSWAMGKAVVSTSVGCEGLEAIDGHNILIRDDPTEFAAAVLQVLRDRDLRDRLGREGRRTAEEHYSWRVVGQKLIGLYDNLMIEAASSSAR